VEKNCTVSDHEPRTISSTTKTSRAASSTVTSAEPAVLRKGQREAESGPFAGAGGCESR
jgi:hypothetical protein